MHFLKNTSDGYRKFYNVKFNNVTIEDLNLAVEEIRESVNRDNVKPYKALVFYPHCLEPAKATFERALAEICSNYSIVEVIEDLGNILICAVDSDTVVENVIVNGKVVGKKTVVNGTQYYDVCNLTNSLTVADGAYEGVYKEFYELINVCSDMQLIRTWCWLKDILSYYTEFNSERNKTFKRIGFIGDDGVKLPASTGIGPYCSNSNFFIMDSLFVDKDTDVKFWYSTGKQQSAYNYGSAFSRMVCIHKDSAREFYLSGTAAILNNGESYARGDVKKQICNMIENVQAALNCEELKLEDVCYGFVYCKDREIYEALCEMEALKNYNVTPIIADICREELLIEMEVYAAKQEG